MHPFVASCLRIPLPQKPPTIWQRNMERGIRRAEYICSESKDGDECVAAWDYVKELSTASVIKTPPQKK